MEEKGYIDSRIDEVKYQVTKTLTVAISKLLSTLIIALFAVVFVCFASAALVQWLNSILGAPFGTLCVAAALLVLVLILVLLRKKLFLNSAARLFSSLMMGEKRSCDYKGIGIGLAKARANTKIQEERLLTGYGIVRAAPGLIRVGKLVYRLIRKAVK